MAKKSALLIKCQNVLTIPSMSILSVSYCTKAVATICLLRYILSVCISADKCLTLALAFWKQ